MIDLYIALSMYAMNIYLSIHLAVGLLREMSSCVVCWWKRRRNILMMMKLSATKVYEPS